MTTLLAWRNRATAALKGPREMADRQAGDAATESAAANCAGLRRTLQGAVRAGGSLLPTGRTPTGHAAPQRRAGLTYLKRFNKQWRVYFLRGQN